MRELLPIYFGPVTKSVGTQITWIQNKNWNCKCCEEFNASNGLEKPDLISADPAHGNIDRLFDHIKNNHDDWKEKLYNERNNQNNYFGTASAKAKNI